MAFPDETLDQVHQRSVRLSLDAWAELQARGVLERQSTTKLSAYLLKHYLELEHKPIYHLPEDLDPKQTRSIYTTDRTWAATKALAVRQRRTVSDILEQIIRAYLGLRLGTLRG